MNENLLNKYEEYYQNGGTYVIPAEIFYDLVDELEQVNVTIDYKSAYENVMVANGMLRKEFDRLKQEIKEIKKKQNCDLKWALKYDELFIENKELHNKLEKANATIDTNIELIEHLGNKIDKAIEYINSAIPCIHDDELLDDLLEILKDSGVDE